MACNLKLKAGTPHEPIINEILMNLNLNHRRSVHASHLSGGEKRRLSIALELVANPTIFFLDEPTSGLDEVTAAQCIRLLKNLAKQGKTVVCTIHTPSAGIFALFDQVFVLARGLCVFQGAPTTMVPFLSYVNMVCPKHYSPSDYIIELCDSEDATIVSSLAEMTQNGKLMCAPYEEKANEAAGSDSAGIRNDFALIMKNAITQMTLDKPKTRGALLEKMKAFSRFMHSDHAISGPRQFVVLLQLMMVKTVRNKTVLTIQLFHHVFCGIIFGKFEIISCLYFLLLIAKECLMTHVGSSIGRFNNIVIKYKPIFFMLSSRI